MMHPRLKGLDERDPYVIYFADYITNLRRYHELQEAIKGFQGKQRLDIEREITWTEYAIDRAIGSMQATLESLTST